MMEILGILWKGAVCREGVGVKGCLSGLIVVKLCRDNKGIEA